MYQYQQTGPPGVDWHLMACHEAGHAVVAIALGLEVEWVGFMPTDDIPGGCRISQPDIPFSQVLLFKQCTPDTAKRLWDNAVFAIAGMLVEQAVEKNSGPGRKQDEKQVRFLYDCLSTGGATTLTFEEFWHEVQKLAYEKLRQNAEALDAVTKELYEQGELTGQRVRQILAEQEKPDNAPHAT